jgi:polysaccharide export outer membrane protein
MTNRKQVFMLGAVLAAGMTLGLTAWGQQESSSHRGKKGAEAPRLSASALPAGSDWRQSVKAAVNPNEYIVGEADILHIDVWKEPELNQSVVVRPDGKISLPLVSEVKVGGMTPAQIQQLLTERLKAYIVSPQVTVTVTDIRSKSVYITGEIVRAGEYPMLAPMTVLQLIARAGGVSPYANKKSIFVLRYMDGKPVRYPFNYNSVIKGKNVGQDIELRPGDTVVVP